MVENAQSHVETLIQISSLQIFGVLGETHLASSAGKTGAATMTSGNAPVDRPAGRATLRACEAGDFVHPFPTN